MGGSTRSELAYSSPEGLALTATAYPNGQRGSHSGPGMERSGSFRESLDSRAMSSGAGVAQGTGSASPAEIRPLSQSLLLEPISLGDQKYTRYGELRRVLGVSLEEHSFGSVQCKPLPHVEEIKRFKESLLDSSTRARDRGKLLHELIAKLERHHNLLTRKRQRNENSSGEKSGGTNLLKLGNQAHQNPSDLVARRMEERAKSTMPNKRLRSSMSEGRGNLLLKQGTALEKGKNNTTDRDKNMIRACNAGLLPVEDKLRGLPTVGDGWDKNMKRKRSMGTVVTRIMDGDREPKPAMLHRLTNELRPRSFDGPVSRSCSSGGTIGINKLEGSSQPTIGGARTVPRSDLDNVSLPNGRKENSAALDKERCIPKDNNKLTIRADYQIGTQSSLTKRKASRTPRTGPNAVMNSSSSFPRTSGCVDGSEQPPCLNKLQPMGTADIRKRPVLTGSSSPPVAQWVGQRPQKISRTRRTNLVSPVSDHEEAPTFTERSPAPNAGARLTSINTSAPSFSRGTSDNPQQLKMKVENVSSPSILSESDESGTVENKYTETGIDNSEGEDRTVGTVSKVQKATTVILPMRKTEVRSKEDIGDGVRRQGRSGRVPPQIKSGLPLMKEKLENVYVANPLRSGRPGSDRSESRVGRPPSKKLSDRKAFTRPGHTITGGTSELTGESNNDHDELVAAANYARDSCNQTCSSSFWKKMKPFFTFVGSDSIAYLKQQIMFAEELDGSLCNMDDAYLKGEHSLQRSSPSLDFEGKETCLVKGDQTNVGHGRTIGSMSSIDESCQGDAALGKFETDGWLERFIPLSQRLLSAFITEDEAEIFDSSTEWKDSFSQFASDYSFDTNDSANHEINDAENLIEPELGLKIPFQIHHISSGKTSSCNGHTTSNSFRSPTVPTIKCHSYSNGLTQGNNCSPHSDIRVYSEPVQNNLDVIQNAHRVFPDLSPYELQYEHMSLDAKILLELQSIGLYPDMEANLVGKEDEINKDIYKLKARHYQQVRAKRHRFSKLVRAVSDVRAVKERNLEQLAMNKLVEVAHRKFLGGRVNPGSSSKGGASKISKHAAMAFAKRTLARCQKFEDTGRSCFSEPPLHGIIISEPLCGSNAKSVNNFCTYAEPVSGFLSSVVERHEPTIQYLDKDSLDSSQGVTHMHDQSFAKQELVLSRGKRREVLLDDAGNPSTFANNLPGGAKGKRSERERDHNKDSSARSPVAKAVWPSFAGNPRGERKTKTKPKQKTAQLPDSGNGLLGGL